jgi:hypothetical protein
MWLELGPLDSSCRQRIPNLLGRLQLSESRVFLPEAHGGNKSGAARPRIKLSASKTRCPAHLTLLLHAACCTKNTDGRCVESAMRSARRVYLYDHIVVNTSTRNPAIVRYPTNRSPPRVPAPAFLPNMKTIRVRGIRPIATCIQKPIQPKREKAFARLSLIDGLQILLSVCNVMIPAPCCYTHLVRISHTIPA